MTFESDLQGILTEAGALLLRKHQNYGPKNISLSPGGPLNGLRVRLHDKFARVNHMIDNNTVDVVGEPLEETFIDALNYCAIAVMVLRGQWPSGDEDAEAPEPNGYEDAAGFVWKLGPSGWWSTDQDHRRIPQPSLAILKEVYG